MISFLKKFSEHVKNTPDKTAVIDRQGERATSYGSLNDLSGKIASCLKESGISREDVVLINCSRSMELIAARLGVMKAGAALVVVENMLGKERIDYIINDCNAAFSLDDSLIEKTVAYDPLPENEWADPDPHDLAFIVYTSGSTGNPKGAAHEYGVYDYIITGTAPMLEDYSPLFFANIIPESYVGGIYITVGLLYFHGTIHELPLELVRDPEKLLSYFDDHTINDTFMPPTLAGALISTGRLKLSALHVGGEIVSEIYSEDFDVKNIYGPTEFGYPTCIFKLDRAYGNTPVGFPQGDTDIRLLGDDGEISSGQGVLCVKLPFFRGYLHDNNDDSFF